MEAESIFSDYFVELYRRLKITNSKVKSLANLDIQAHVLHESINYPILLSCLIEKIESVDGYKSFSYLIVGTHPFCLHLIKALNKNEIFDITIYDPDYKSHNNLYSGHKLINQEVNFPEYDICLDLKFLTKKTIPRQLEKKNTISLNSIAIFNEYKRKINIHLVELSLSLKKYNAAQKVIFVAKQVYFNQIRYSLALRERGYMTCSISLGAKNEGAFEGFFDTVVHTDLLSFLLAFARQESCLLHTQGWMFGYHIPVIIDAFKPVNCKQVIEVMDLNSFLLDEEKIQILLPDMKKAWGENVLNLHELQLKCEKYMVHESDGLIIPGDNNFQKALKQQYPGKSTMMLNFLSYPIKDFIFNVEQSMSPQRPKNLKLVYTGSIIPTTLKHPESLFGNGYMVDISSLLLKQGFSLDIYHNPAANQKESMKFYYPELMKLMEENSHFRILAGKYPWLLNKDLGQYHFGIILFDFSIIKTSYKQTKYILPSKLLGYIEAGLPVLVSEEQEAICDFVTRWEIGIIIKKAHLNNIFELIRSHDYSVLRKNVKKVRNVLSMENESVRLIDFYKCLL